MTDSIVGQTIVAYHGCDLEVAMGLADGSIGHLRPSKNPYDWLGDGMYFFEDDYLRAFRFAETAARHPEKKLTKKPITTPYVIGAVICLGNCLDLSKQLGIEEFRAAHGELVSGMGEGYEMPVNKPANPEDEDMILHHLDRAVINYIHGKRIEDSKTPYDTVRGFFHQGGPVVGNSAVGRLSHVQIAVRNSNCILGYFLRAPTLTAPFQGLNVIPAKPYRKQTKKKA